MREAGLRASLPPHCPVLPALRLVPLRLALGSLTLVIIAALILPGVAQAASRSVAQVAAETKEAARRLDLQQDLPTEVARQLDIQSRLPHEEEEPPSPQWHLSLPPDLLWLLVAFGLILLVWALKDVIPAFSTGEGGWGDATAPGEAVGAVPGAAEAAQVAADDLARQGRFAEAMHVLLLQSLGDIRRRLDERLADSLTSREILHRIRISDLGLASLRDIISRVERTYFGEYPAGVEDYQGCRASFGTLTEALGGPVPA